MDATRRRTIVYDPLFEEQMAEFEPNIKRADEFIEGAETILSRSPESGFQLEDSSVWFVPGHTVDLVLYYTFDENHVYFLSIQRAFPPEL